MYCGAQISLYPMCDDFINVILSSLSALDPYRDQLKIETDDISTLLSGPPTALFPAMAALFVRTAETGHHVTMHALISRGCPGGGPQPSTTATYALSDSMTSSERKAHALKMVQAEEKTGQQITVQFAYYPLGDVANHMDEIYACIDFIEASGTFVKMKNFCTKLRGDAGPVFKTLEQAFLCFAGEEKHVALDLTLSANSPSIAND